MSASLYDRAAIIPGRSLTRSKAPDRLLRAWASSGNGAYVYDTDQRPLLDMVCGLGAISLGYQATREHTDYWAHGVYSLPHEAEIDAAEAVLRHVAPWASAVRFVKTGSEATHAAYRMAKKATGRPLTLKGDWAYHGRHEWTDEHALEFPHGADLSRLYSEFDQRRIAAVFVEPHRWQPVDVEWLKAVRAFCDRSGALLVFDEMIYGGRWALGGASEYYGVQPDLACYGKAFGNGQAVAFVAGREALAEHGEIVSGTYSGDVTGLTAVLDTLQVYTSEPVIETLWARGKQLQDGLRQVIPASLGTVEGAPVHPRIRFADPAVNQPYDYRPSVERPLAHRFKEAMAQRGVLCTVDWFLVMYAHTEQQINQVIEAAEQSVKELR